MTELKSIEQVLHFMKGHIHLSRYDEKFIENISVLKQVTTNQVVLFHTLVYKYRRQFVKHELDVDKLVELPWNVTVVESSPQYTDGYVNIENNNIYFKCPFNRSFIDEFRKTPNNEFVWQKDDRQYEAPYNQYSLKILLQQAKKYFRTINLCPVTQRLLQEVKQYEHVKYWNPTLTRLNGNLYIVAMNESLYEALGDIELNTDDKTLVTLAGYGITIDPSLYNNDVKSKFIANSIVQVEQANVTDMVTWLKELNCDMVYLSGAGLLNLTKKSIIQYLIESDIPFHDTTNVVTENKNYEFPVLIRLRKNFGSNYDPCKVSKVINVVNSLPIEIK